MEEKVLSLGKFSVVSKGDLASQFWFTENTFFGTSSNDKKTDNGAKRNNNIQFYLLD